jgi:hypothetical protein
MQTLEQVGYTPSAFALTPADWAGIELALSSTNARRPGIPPLPSPCAAARSASPGTLVG